MLKAILSKIGKWLSNNKLILILVFLSFVILGYPLIVLGIEKSFFYSIDPDVVYVTNALLYAKAKMIVYIDHPGTPMIMLLNYLYFPLRLIAKYVLHENFIQWSFDNYAFLTYYSRIFQLLISISGLAIFINLIKKSTKSTILTITAYFLTFLFTGLTTALYIRPENFSFLLTACWLGIFVKFINTKKYIWTALLAVLSGFIFANKFTGLFLVFYTVFLPIFIKKEKLTTRLIMVQANIALILESFLIGTWPIQDKITSVLNWGLHLFNHADIHGTGANKFLDVVVYTQSLQNLVYGNIPLSIFLILTVFFSIILLIKKKVKFGDPIILLNLVAFFGILIFAKYPVIHYNFVNIFLMIYVSIYLLSKTKPIWSKLTMLVVGVIFTINVYSNTIAVLNSPLQKIPGGINVVLKQWTPFWSADIFKEQFEASSSAKL